MSQAHGEKMDAYRILFPVGLLTAFLGLLLWVLFQFRGISFYPRFAHANLMYFGFFWSFIAGFLMTAVPRMTGVLPTQVLEIGAAAFLVFMQIALNIRNLTDVSVYLFVSQNLFLLVFLARRLWLSGKVPFEGFVFIPFAFAQAFVGVFLWSRGQGEFLYLLSGEAFILNLIFGLGSRLIPVLSRIPNALAPDAQGTLGQLPRLVLWALVLNLSFYLQVLIPSVGHLLKVAVVVGFAVQNFKVLRKPSSFSFVGFGLRLAIAFIVLSSVLSLMGKYNQLAVQHLSSIGGLMLLTLMVATRVMLAHGGQSLDYELRSKRVLLVLLCLSIAALLRLLAGTDVVGLELRVSIYVALLGLALWSWKFIKVLRAV